MKRSLRESLFELVWDPINRLFRSRKPINLGTWTRQRARYAARRAVFFKIFQQHARVTKRSVQYAPEYTRRLRRKTARIVARQIWRAIPDPTKTQ